MTGPHCALRDETAGESSVEYDQAEPERFEETFGVAGAQETVAQHGVYTPRVAVLDTTMPDKAGDDKGTEKLNVVKEITIGNPDNEVKTHMTASAGVVSRVTGVSNIEILAVEVIYEPGVDYSVQMAKGIEQAVENGADVITMSVSWKDNDRLKSAVKMARENGVILLSSAGNENKRLPDAARRYPQSYSSVVVGGATDSHGKRASFPNDRFPNAPKWGSNYAESGNDEMWLSAWGRGIPTIVPDAADGRDDTAEWYEKGEHSGTSGATPTIAGVVALILAVNPELTQSEAVRILRETGRPVETNRPIGPRVYAADAVKKAANMYDG